MHISLAHSVCILGGHRVVGWGEDGDAITLPDITVAETVVGADGKLMAQSTGDQGGEVTLKLLPISPSCQFFMQQFAAILRGAQIVWDGSIDYGPLGARVILQRGVLTAGPAGQTIGKSSAAMREWTFMFETIIPNYDAANFSGPPPIQVGGPVARVLGG